ncbi:SDR family oxidoreductase [Nocardia sp. X0981]
MFELNGRTALVSGAGQSVGEGIATVLARQGAAVIVNDLFAERADRVAAKIVALGHQANLADKMPPEMIDQIISTIPIGRLGDPIEVGAFCAYPASDESGGMTGRTLDFNGGSQTR